MTDVYFLIHTEKDGREVLVGTYTTMSELLKAVTLFDVVEFYLSAGYMVPKMRDNYAIKSHNLGLAVPVAPSPAPKVTPDFWVEVKSLSKPGTQYSVGIHDQTVMSCSCPDFKNHRKQLGEYCKHMKLVFMNPSTYNIAHRNIRFLGRLEQETPPKRVIKVPSFDAYGKTYDVTLSGSNIVSCTCPHFTNRLKTKGDYCKHMSEVDANWQKFSLGFWPTSLGRE